MSIGKQDIFFKNVRPKEIDIKEYFNVIKKRIWIIFLFTILSVLGGYYYDSINNNYVPLYSTSTKLIIGTDEEYMKTLMVMIKDPIVLEIVKKDLNLDKSIELIANQIEVSKVENSKVISISVTDNDPIVAVNIANDTAKIFKDQAMNILKFSNIQLLSPAIEKSTPVNESKNMFLKISLPLGLIIGIGLAFLLDSLDETLKRDSDIEEYLGVPVMGVVSNMNKKKLLREKKKYKILELKGEMLDI